MSSVPATPIQQAVGRIHKVIEERRLLEEGASNVLKEAFDVLDHSEFLTNEDALAVLSVVKLMMKHILEVNADRVKTDGDAILMVYATAYLGRAAATLEQNNKAASIDAGQREM